MKIRLSELREIIREEARRLREAGRTPSNEEVEEWWDMMSPGGTRAVARQLRLSSDDRERWNARDWESVVDYFVRVEMGDDRGWERGRNV